VRALDLATGREVARWDLGALRVGCLAWSPQGTRLAAGGATGLRLLDLRGGGQEALGGVRSTQSVAWSPQGERLAVGQGGWDTLACVLDLATGSEDASWQHEGCVLAVAWNPQGTKVATGSVTRDGGGLLRSFDASTGAVEMEWRYEYGPHAVAWRP